MLYSKDTTTPPDAVTFGVIKDQVDPTLEEYSKDNPFPYVSKLMKLDTPFDFLPESAKNQLSDIDKYIDKVIEERRLPSKLSTYEKILGELEFEMTEGDGLSMSEKIERFGNYARNYMKLDGLDDVRDTLVKKMLRMRRGSDMDNLILKEIGRRII